MRKLFSLSILTAAAALMLGGMAHAQTVAIVGSGAGSTGTSVAQQGSVTAGVNGGSALGGGLTGATTHGTATGTSTDGSVSSSQ